MPIDTRPLTDNEVIVRLIDLGKFSEAHTDDWRNQTARYLNSLVTREIYVFETHGIVSDYSAAILRIVERIAEFEEIKTVVSKKPESEWQVNTYSNPFYAQPKCEVLCNDGKILLLTCPKCARGMFSSVVKWRSVA